MDLAYTSDLEISMFWLRGSSEKTAKHTHYTNIEYEGIQQDWPEYTNINLGIKGMQSFLKWIGFIDIKYLESPDTNFY